MTSESTNSGIVFMDFFHQGQKKRMSNPSHWQPPKDDVYILYTNGAPVR